MTRYLLPILLMSITVCRVEQVEANSASAKARVQAGAAGRLAPEPLSPEDFVVDGLRIGPDGLDSLAVRDAFGAPDSVTLQPNPFVPSAAEDLWARWSYRDLQVHFTGTVSAHGLTLSGPSRQTHRGARVGDSPARVQALYGAPEGQNPWTYTDPADEYGLHVLQFTFRAGRVHQIFVGNLLD